MKRIPHWRGVGRWPRRSAGERCITTRTVLPRGCFPALAPAAQEVAFGGDELRVRASLRALGVEL